MTGRGDFVYWAAPDEMNSDNASIAVGAGDLSGVGERAALLLWDENGDNCVDAYLTLPQLESLIAALTGAHTALRISAEPRK